MCLAMRSLRTPNDLVNPKTAGVAVIAVAAVIALVIVTSTQFALLLVSTATLLVSALAFRRSSAALHRADRLGARLGRMSKRDAARSEEMRRIVRRALRRARDADSLNAARLDWISRRSDDSTASISDGIEGVNAQVAGGRKQLGDRFAQLDDRLTHISDTARATASGVRRLERDISGIDLRRRIVGDVAAVLALRTDGQPGRLLPIWSDWGLAPQVLLEVINVVRDAGPNPLVVELGTGDSTLWIAKTLAERGDGRLISFEHDEAYGSLTRARLSAAGLDDWVEMRVAPLRHVEIDGETYPWYDLVGDLTEVRVLIVDGPPGNTGHLARLPAFPMLSQALEEDAIVLLDDADRPDEQEIIKRWTKSPPEGARRLVALRSVDRAVLFETRSP